MMMTMSMMMTSTAKMLMMMSMMMTKMFMMTMSMTMMIIVRNTGKRENHQTM